MLNLACRGVARRRPPASNRGSFQPTMPNEEDPNYRAAREAQNKFDQYFPALTFTVLGLGVQTAKWGYPPSDRLELGAWDLIFLAGVLSLWRLEAAPVFFLRQARISEEQVAVQLAEMRRETPNRTELSKLSTEQDRAQRGTVFLYRVQRTSLVVGIAAMMAARAVFGLPRLP